MSEIRVDKIQAYQDSFSVTIAGITTFSGTGCVSMPGGTSTQRPEVAKKGQLRYINGDVKKGLEYYNGTEWITVGVANGSVPEGTAPIGVFGGGQTPTLVNTIDYIAITSEGNATDFGDLSSARSFLSACSSSSRGVFGGGTPIAINIIEYITIATTGNASGFGDLTEPRRALAACSSSTRGIFGGGRIVEVPAIIDTNTIDYITIATTGNALDFGDLLVEVESITACSSSTRGVFGGGSDVLYYITIATTGNATDFGELTQGRLGLAACSSSTRGVFGGGQTPTIVNTIDYITIATTGNATDFGDLTQVRSRISSCSSSTRGVFGGGQTPTIVNTIDYITIATTGNATDFGDLTQSRTALAALSNSHGGLLAS
jgi:hypothetical protein